MSLSIDLALPWTLAAYAALGCVACMRWESPSRALLLSGVASTQAAIQSRFILGDEIEGLLTQAAFVMFPLLSGGVAALLAGGRAGKADRSPG